MDIQLRDRFTELWNEHFSGADLPIAFYYSDEDVPEPERAPLCGERCMIADLQAAFSGATLRLSKAEIKCPGGRRYTGYSPNLRGDFRHFLSHGTEHVEGERYKKTPELVDELLEVMPPVDAKANYLVAKRWDKLTETDEPELVCFFARPDVLSGLFTLANYDFPDMNGVVAPFSSGCASIIYNPLEEAKQDKPRAVLGMFDVSARPHVDPGVMSFTVPFKRFTEMIENMPESFLITESWQKIRKRIDA